MLYSSLNSIHYTAECITFFVVLYFIKVENFVEIIEGLGRPAWSLRIFCVIYNGFSIKKFVMYNQQLNFDLQKRRFI